MSGDISLHLGKKGETSPLGPCSVCVCVKNDACVVEVKHNYLFIFLGGLCLIVGA